MHEPNTRLSIRLPAHDYQNFGIHQLARAAVHCSSRTSSLSVLLAVTAHLTHQSPVRSSIRIHVPHHERERSRQVPRSLRRVCVLVEFDWVDYLACCWCVYRCVLDPISARVNANETYIMYVQFITSMRDTSRRSSSSLADTLTFPSVRTVPPSCLFSSRLLTPYSHYSTVMSWQANNTGSQSQRAVSLGMLNTIGQCLSILASFIFPSSEGPKWVKGFSVNLAVRSISFPLSSLSILPSPSRTVNSSILRVSSST